MRLSTLLRIGVIVLVSAVTLMATARDVLHYRRYGIADGLPHRVVSTIVQDPRGYIWLGTWNGLSRFDGERFEAFSQDHNGRRLGRIDRLRLTLDGMLYVVPHTGTPYLFNPETFEPHRLNGEVALHPYDSIPNQDIRIDRTGLYVMHDSEAYHIPAQRDNLRYPREYEAFRDRQGVIWTSYDNALVALSFASAPYAITSDCDYEVRALCVQSDSVMLMSCVYRQDVDRTCSLVRVDPQGNIIDYVNAEGKLTEEMSEFGAVISCIVCDGCGRFWLSSNDRGLYCWIPDEQRIVHYDEGNSQLALNSITTLYYYEGFLWIGTWGRGVQILKVNNPTKAEFCTRGEVDGKVRSFCLMKGDESQPELAPRVVASTRSGLRSYDATSGALYMHIGDMDFTCVLPTQSGHTLAATKEMGIYDVTPEYDFVPVDLPEASDFCMSMIETSEGNLWVIGENEVSHFDEMTGYAERMSGQDFEGVAFVRNALAQQGTTLWVGMRTGFMRIDLTAPFAHVPTLEVQRPDPDADSGPQWRLLFIVLLVLVLGIIQILAFEHWRARQKPTHVNLVPSSPKFTPVEEQFVERLTTVVESAIGDADFSIEQMCEQMGMSRTSLYEQCRQALSTTPASFLQEIRIKRGMQLLASGQYRVNEVSYMVGFADPKYFARVFRRLVGEAPGQYLAKQKKSLSNSEPETNNTNPID